MKSKLLIITLSLTLSVFVNACPKQSGDPCERGNRQGGHRTMMLEKLNLTEEQRIKFDDIMEKRNENRHQSMKKNHEEIKLLLSEFLSEEQMKIMADNRPQHPRKHKKSRRHHDNS